jgi:hypothetical protein
MPLAHEDVRALEVVVDIADVPAAKQPNSRDKGSKPCDQVSQLDEHSIGTKRRGEPGWAATSIARSDIASSGSAQVRNAIERSRSSV